MSLEAADRLDRILSSIGCTFEMAGIDDGVGHPAHILDCDGDRLCPLNDSCVTAILSTPDAVALPILQQLRDTALVIGERSRKAFEDYDRERRISETGAFGGVPYNPPAGSIER